MINNENPKQFSARKLRVAIEQAKVAVMEAQNTLIDYRGNATTFEDLFSASLRRLDSAWVIAAREENSNDR